VIGPTSLLFLSALGSRLAQQSGEAKSSSYLLQRLSIAVQRSGGTHWPSWVLPAVHTMITFIS